MFFIGNLVYFRKSAEAARKSAESALLRQKLILSEKVDFKWKVDFPWKSWISTILNHKSTKKACA